MLISDMRALRFFCPHKKSILFLNHTKNPISLPQFSRQFHATAALRSASQAEEPDSSRRVWSTCGKIVGVKADNLSDRDKTRTGLSTSSDVNEDLGVKVENLSDRDEIGTQFSSSSDEIEDLEEKNRWAGGKVENLSDTDENGNGLSIWTDGNEDLEKKKSWNGRKVENLSVRDENGNGLSSSSDGHEDLVKKKSWGGVNKKNLGGGGKSQMRLMSYSEGDEGLVKIKRYGSGGKMDSSSNVGSRDVRSRGKKSTSNVSWVCQDCGHTEVKWWGICPECKVGMMKEFVVGDSKTGSKVTGVPVSENVMRSWVPQKPGEVQPLRLIEVNQGTNQLDWRIPLLGLFGSEVARVLGGGLVPGSLVLIGGDPGVGKSTLLLQIAAMVAEGQGFGESAPVVYVSGEESVEQIANRAHRLGIETEELFLYSTTDIEDMLEKTQRLSPRAVIIDSIQTVFLKGVTGSAGGLYQVKECTQALLHFAKRTNIPVLLVGHVTKSGDIAGPRVLEHIVDVVLYMEGEKYSSHRLLRPVKNRFGSTDELGVFEMLPSGLQAVSNPSEIFLNKQHFNSNILAGLAVAVIMDGSRSFLIEIQALCISEASGTRHVNGIQASRADMIISVLMKQARLEIQPNAVLLNVVSGVTLTETAGDLAIAAAICSSCFEFPIPHDFAFIGEIGLAGEIRTVPRMEKRVNTVAKLGYKKCFVPKLAEDFLTNLDFEGMEIIGCNDIKEVINLAFKKKIT